MYIKLFTGTHKQVEKECNDWFNENINIEVKSITHRTASKYSEYVSLMIVYEVM